MGEIKMTQPTLRLFDGYPHTSPALKAQVKNLQQELKSEGYLIQPDGCFGEGTEASVKQFQSEKGLLSDGIVGPATWRALLQEPPTPSHLNFSTTLKKNDVGMLKHLTAALKYEKAIYKCAEEFELPPALICGIGSRESAWGLALKPAGPAGTGDFIARRAPTRYRKGPLPVQKTGFGRGLMQIDFDAHEFARTGNWQEADDNINYGCSVLSECGNTIARLTGLTGMELTQAALASYNCGVGRVIQAIHSNLAVDYFTAGRNYSEDTLNRAGFFEMNHWL